MSNAPRKRAKAQERMIRRMTKRGGKGFRILRSAEAVRKRYRRAALDGGDQ